MYCTVPIRLNQANETLNDVLKLLKVELLLLMLEGFLLHLIDSGGNLLNQSNGLRHQGMIWMISVCVFQKAL